MAAIEHVRGFFPEVVLVVFNDMGRWQYMTEDYGRVSFENVPVDLAILEAAADESHDVAGHPCVFQPYTSEPMTRQSSQDAADDLNTQLKKDNWPYRAAAMESGARRDVTDAVVLGWVDDEVAQLKKCVCGHRLEGGAVISIYPNNAFTCPACGVKLVIQQSTRVFQL